MADELTADQTCSSEGAEACESVAAEQSEECEQKTDGQEVLEAAPTEPAE